MVQGYLQTYNPDIFESHADSTDFESSIPPWPSVKNKPGYHRLVKPSHRPTNKTVYYDQIVGCDYPTKEISGDSRFKECQVDNSLLCLKKRAIRYYRHLNRRNQPDQKQSRLCILRQRVLPRLSSMFRQSVSHRVMDAPCEIRPKNTSSQQCQTYLRKQKKKPYSGREKYIVRPVYALQGDVHSPKAPTPKDSPKNMKNSCSHTSTTGSDAPAPSRPQPQKMKQNRSIIKKRFRAEMMREHWNYQQMIKQKHYGHQTSTLNNTPVQHVYSSSQCKQAALADSISDYSCLAEMPSSGFWDFLFEKIHNKYQTYKCEVQPCPCASNMAVAMNMQNANPTPIREGLTQTPDEPCCHDASTCCNQSFARKPPNQNTNITDPSNSDQIIGETKRSSTSVQKGPVHCRCKPKKMRSSSKASARVGPEAISKDTEMVPQQCSPPLCPPDCFSEKFMEGSPTGQRECSPICSQKCSPMQKQDVADSKPCQENHDEVTQMLRKQYNGEILCIHNPPCILINGCLNLPPTKAEMMPTQEGFWPVLFKNKSYLSKRKDIFNKKKDRTVQREKSCQYGVPFVQVHQCETFNKSEKRVQSVCSHDPPCEVVRSCDKKKYDRSLENPCVHVPMCKKRPECAVNHSPRVSLNSYACEHLPMCPEIPVYNKAYGGLPPTDNVGVQANPRASQACRHDPPCIMVPKCMGGVSILNNYLPYEAIADCSHNPTCEAIPACCRKNHKEMVSVSSQYPNSCRIV